MLVVGFTVAGILIGSSYNTTHTMSLREVWAMAVCAFIPAVNTFIAIFIISIAVWLIVFKPGSKPNPPA
jgi:hypothetical protein